MSGSSRAPLVTAGRKAAGLRLRAGENVQISRAGQGATVRRARQVTPNVGGQGRRLVLSAEPQRPDAFLQTFVRVAVITKASVAVTTSEKLNIVNCKHNMKII
jgi:hypothetical protein